MKDSYSFKVNNKETLILVVDDDSDIREIIRYNLSLEGYRVVEAKNGHEAVKQALKFLPQLILLDVMMPKMNGIEACKKIRSYENLNDTIIAFLSARTEDLSQVEGFDAGADDYIIKPIAPKVLKSRIKALLRRSKKTDVDYKIHLEGLTIDRNEFKVTLNNEEIELPRKEFELLFLLASQPEKVFNREEILNAIWGSEVVVGDRTIDVHIRKLREKLGEDKFRTVKGIGYQFVNGANEK